MFNILDLDKGGQNKTHESQLEQFIDKLKDKSAPKDFITKYGYEKYYMEDKLDELNRKLQLYKHIPRSSAYKLKKIKKNPLNAFKNIRSRSDGCTKCKKKKE